MEYKQNRFLLSGEGWTCKDFLAEDWIWRNAEKQHTGDTRFWRPAVVPGCPTADLLRIGEIPDPFYEKNSLAVEWIPQRTWIYRKEFELPAKMKGKKLILHFSGVDYDARFYLNDVLLGEHHSMFGLDGTACSQGAFFASCGVDFSSSGGGTDTSVCAGKTGSGTV